MLTARFPVRFVNTHTPPPPYTKSLLTSVLRTSTGKINYLVKKSPGLIRQEEFAGMETPCCLWQTQILLVEHVSAIPWQKRSLSCWISEFTMVLWKKGRNWEAAFHCVAFWRVWNKLHTSLTCIYDKLLFSRCPPHHSPLYFVGLYVSQLMMLVGLSSDAVWFLRASSTGHGGRRGLLMLLE